MPLSKALRTKQVSFRVPFGVHADYVAIAESRGVDLSAILNWIVVECRPALLLQKARHDAAMLHAVVPGLPQVGAVSQESLAQMNELIRSLQETASKLATWVGVSPQEKEQGT